jgi:hypothetical protein
VLPHAQPGPRHAGGAIPGQPGGGGRVSCARARAPVPEHAPARPAVLGARRIARESRHRQHGFPGSLTQPHAARVAAPLCPSFPQRPAARAGRAVLPRGLRHAPPRGAAAGGCQARPRARLPLPRGAQLLHGPHGAARQPAGALLEGAAATAAAAARWRGCAGREGWSGVARSIAVVEARMMGSRVWMGAWGLQGGWGGAWSLGRARGRGPGRCAVGGWDVKAGLRRRWHNP